MKQQIKILLKELIVPYLFHIGFFDLLLFFFRKKTVTLMFHGVYKESDLHSFNPRHISINNFQKLICFLKKYFDIIPLAELYELIKQKKLKNIKRNNMVITFDDGYKNNLLIEPIIKYYSIPITIFITTNYLSNRRGSVDDTIDFVLSRISSSYLVFNKKKYLVDNKSEKLKLKRDIHRMIASDISKEQIINEFIPPSSSWRTYEIIRSMHPFFEYLSEKDIKHLSKNHLITIGSHTENHLDLTLAPSKKVTSELENSKKRLEFLTHKKVIFFSYPYGHYNNRVKKEVSENYYAACAIHLSCRNKDAYEIPRVGISAVDNFYIQIGHIIEYLIKDSL